MSLDKYQSKSITPVDNYECTLSDELQKIANVELGETSEKRIEGLHEMREWIMNNPRIEKCRMDANFIMRFLRFRKFDVARAQDAFERYLIFHEGAYGYDWFSNLDFDAKPNVDDLMNKGLIIVFPKRDKFGRLTVLTHLAATDPNIPSIGNEGLSLATMLFETLLEDEENQIRGFNYVLDISNIKLRHYFIFSFSTWFKFGKNVEQTCAARHKGIHVVNVHPSLKFIAKLALKHMPKKFKERVRFYSNFDELKVLEKSELPVECGGSVPSAELTDPLKELLQSRKNFFLAYNDMKINRSLYPENVLKCDVDTLNKKLGYWNRPNSQNANVLEID